MFKNWLETIEARTAGSRQIVLNFLKDKLHIKDEDVILQMNTTDLEDSVINDLLARGIISTSNSEIINRISNGITISDLIDLLASEIA